jgi:hypothetical protein
LTGHRLAVTALGVCLLTASVLAAINVAVEYHDLQSMLTGSAFFAVLVLVPGMVGWGLIKRNEFARRIAVILFASLGLLIAVLGFVHVVHVGLSIRIYRALLFGGVFCLLARYLRRDVVRHQFARKDVQQLSLS